MFLSFFVWIGLAESQTGLGEGKSRYYSCLRHGSQLHDLGPVSLSQHWEENHGKWLLKIFPRQLQGQFLLGVKADLKPPRRREKNDLTALDFWSIDCFFYFKKVWKLLREPSSRRQYIKIKCLEQSTKWRQAITCSDNGWWLKKRMLHCRVLMPLLSLIIRFGRHFALFPKPVRLAVKVW